MAIFEQKLRSYAAENKTATDVFHTSLRLFDEMDRKAYHNKEYRAIFAKWLNSGSTIDLKAALSGINYDENNLIHFNAMALLDTVAIK